MATTVFNDTVIKFLDIYDSGDKWLFGLIVNLINLVHGFIPCQKQAVNSCKVIPLKQKRKSRA